MVRARVGRVNIVHRQANRRDLRVAGSDPRGIALRVIQRSGYASPMRVALIGAEFEENLAVRYLRGALEQAGHEVLQIVFNDARDIEWTARTLARTGAELAGLSMVFTWRAKQFVQVAIRARELGYAGHITAGGHFAAFHAEPLLRDVPAIDSVAIGEGERILCELAAAGCDPRAVRGMVYRRGAAIVRNEAAPNPPALDDLPWPPRKQPLDSYLGIPITNMLASRGCSHACAFCSIAAWHRMCGGPRLRLRSVEHVADEMAALYARGARIFNFHDDNFFLDDADAMLARAVALRDALERRGVRHIAFAAKCRPDTMDERVLRVLVSAGLFRLFLGIEAGTDESLHRLGRGQTFRDNERALRIVNELDIHTCFNLLLLNPDSTLEDVEANVAFLRDHPRNPMNFCRTEVYAGTPLHRRLEKQGRLLGDYWGWDYVIADPRAQAAFEVITPAFRTRNYGADCLHHLVMAVDYEHQLLSHFFGSTGALRRAVKAFIVEANLDTCRHLQAIIDAVRALPERADRPLIAARFRVAVEQDNDRLSRKAHSLLQRIRSLAVQRRTQPGWVRSAAAAGIAAALTIAACKDQTHTTETIAPPPQTDGVPPTHPAEMAPEPSEVAADASMPTTGSDAQTDGSAAAATDAALDAKVPPVPATHMHERVPPSPRAPKHYTEDIPPTMPRRTK